MPVTPPGLEKHLSLVAGSFPRYFMALPSAAAAWQSGNDTPRIQFHVRTGSILYTIQLTQCHKINICVIIE